MTLGLALSVVTAFAIGYAAVSLLWPHAGQAGRALLAFRIFLALGLGQGITACLAFVFLVARGRLDASYLFAEPIALLALCGFYVARRRASPQRLRLPAARNPARPAYEWLLAALFAVAVMLAFVAIATGIDRVPHGDWDAWAIYNFRARTIYRAGYDWRDGFSPLLHQTHPDYPPLLPLDVVRAWVYAGSETMAAPRLIECVFVIAAVGIVPSAIGALRGHAQAYIAGIVLVGNAFLLRHAASQYADLPLMFFYGAAGALLVLHEEREREESSGALALAGLAAGLAAWTKNEGLLFVAALGAAHFAVVTRSRGLRRYGQELRSLAVGLVPPLVVLVYFKWTLAPPSDLVTLAARQSLWAKIVDPGRYLTIAGELVRRTPFHVCMLPIYALCVGFGSGRGTGVAQAALAFLLLSAAYIAAYVATPYDLSWHLYTSVDRLLVQIWPLFVLVFFLAVRTPEEARRAVESGGRERPDDSIRS